MKINILIVEDDAAYHRRYKEWLYDDGYDIDSSLSSVEAIEFLIKKHYQVVILDLALDPENQRDRSSRDVQKYLLGQPDGTQHIIVSEHADREDVNDAYSEFGSAGVIFKNKLADDVDLLRKKVRKAIEIYQEKQSEMNKRALLYHALYEGAESRGAWEYNALSVMKAGGGENLNIFLEKVAGVLFPITNHKTKTFLVPWEAQNCMVGLFWSRQKGIPISMCLSHESFNYNEQKSREILSLWLGWSPGEVIHEIGYKNMKALIYSEENNINSNEFRLPLI